MRFLLIEDNNDLAHAVSQRLIADGHVVERAALLGEARAFMATGEFDLMVLDINLPDGLGTDFLKSLRQDNNKTPVLVLTARPEIDDKIDALDLGADDYVVKPFDLDELVARIRAILRRSASGGETIIRCGNLEYRPDRHEFSLNNEVLTLTKTELRLLEQFIINKGRLLEKDKLLDRLYRLDEDVSPNAVELVISRLRKKIAGADLEIKTLRGLGYQAVEIKS